MKNGTHPLKIIKRMRDLGIAVLARSDLHLVAGGAAHPDRAMAELVRAGMVERIGRGVWLVPTGERPLFEIPRFWSNPDLQDPEVISALVMMKPTMRDVARLVLAYGTTVPDRMLRILEEEERIRPATARAARRMLENTRKGFVDAAARRAA